jgi:hypothetical protein
MFSISIAFCCCAVQPLLISSTLPPQLVTEHSSVQAHPVQRGANVYSHRHNSPAGSECIKLHLPQFYHLHPRYYFLKGSTHILLGFGCMILGSGRLPPMRKAPCSCHQHCRFVVLRCNQRESIKTSRDHPQLIASHPLLTPAPCHVVPRKRQQSSVLCRPHEPAVPRGVLVPAPNSSTSFVC